MPSLPDTLIAFDTSTERMAVALYAAGVSIGDDLPGGAAASVGLLPAIEALLRRAGRRMEDVAAVAFGCGPGAFTGLRTSCAVAQGLALGRGCPVLPIDSLRIVAEQARRQRGAADADFEVGVAMDARMGEIYAARYRWRGGDWTVLEAPALVAPDGLGQAWSGDSAPQWVAGSALGLPADPLAAACAASRRIDTGGDRAAALLILARSAWLGGQGLDAESALPLYLRDKVALTSAERAAARGASAR